jgi:hypothetical protein
VQSKFQKPINSIVEAFKDINIDEKHNAFIGEKKHRGRFRAVIEHNPPPIGKHKISLVPYVRTGPRHNIKSCVVLYRRLRGVIIELNARQRVIKLYLSASQIN